MNKELEEIRNNPELIENYLVEKEDIDALHEEGYCNFVDNCDDAELLFIFKKYEEYQTLVKITEQVISNEDK